MSPVWFDYEVTELRDLMSSGGPRPLPRPALIKEKALLG